MYPPQVRVQSDIPAQRDDDGGLGSGSSSIRLFISGGGIWDCTRASIDVARRFRGEGLQKVDAKGRVSIPALFRRVIEACDPNWCDGLPPELVIVYGDSRRNFLRKFRRLSP